MMGRRNQLVNRCSRHRPSEDETLQSSRIPAEPVDKRTVNLYGVDRKTLQPVPKSSITNATPKLFSRCRVSSKWFTSFMNKLSVNSKQSPSGRRCAQGRRRRGQRHREQSFDAQKDSQQLTSRAQGVGDTLLPIARDPRLRIREIASLLDIPERAAQRIDSEPREDWVHRQQASGAEKCLQRTKRPAVQSPLPTRRRHQRSPGDTFSCR